MITGKLKGESENVKLSSSSFLLDNSMNLDFHSNWMDEGMEEGIELDERYNPYFDVDDVDDGLGDIDEYERYVLPVQHLKSRQKSLLSTIHSGKDKKKDMNETEQSVSSNTRDFDFSFPVNSSTYCPFCSSDFGRNGIDEDSDFCFEFQYNFHKFQRILMNRLAGVKC
uniref:Uncharacterized protein n=1 Tax=Caenorhabditis japonica TaxID=281687 RepID=A0A8R1HY16_CAEJA